MGFTKRFITKEQTVTNLANKTVTSLFKKGDVFVFYDD
jgi:hypothetical protein